MNAMGLVFYRKRGFDHSVDTFSALKEVEQYRTGQHVVKKMLCPRFYHMVNIW